MVRKEKKLFIAFTWLMVVLIVAAIGVNAMPATRQQSFEHLVQPQAGCRCCNFVGRVPNLRCGGVCCVDGCC
ncbi:unnamed protein product [Linum tenue]|uniref:Uncharacterized protein n=1 Tax=Linum tenue TaxID=586396 RepID=A0AAV0R1J5_9ROSI|nr:unnamed protein product [Linum tenue]